MIHQGNVSAEIEPVLGESASAPGVYSIPTPVARLSHVRLRDASMTIVAQGTEIDLHIDDSDLTATSGPFAEDAINTIEGYVVVDGNRVDVQGSLEENFDIEKFNARYACQDDLAGPVVAGAQR